MLTITTNKTEIKGIADRTITERSLPITDFWTKRIINLLGFSDSDRNTILHNLAENRPGTTDAEREVTFTAGGAAAVRVKVTIRIGLQSGVDHFILTIRDVLEIRGTAEGEQIQDPEPEVVEVVGGSVVGLKNAPAVRVMEKATGLWAKNTFSDQNGQLQTVLCSIRSTFEGAIDYVTIKIGKRTHKIDTDSDGMIRIRSTFKDSNEETF